jgi:hypothetical protein
MVNPYRRKILKRESRKLLMVHLYLSKDLKEGPINGIWILSFELICTLVEVENNKFQNPKSKV